MVLIRSTTSFLAPSPMASMVMTDATPITMPSKVSAVRNRLLRSDRRALFRASCQSLSTAPLRISAALTGAVLVVVSTPVSRTTSPSAMWIWRRATSATSWSWVIRITVCPWADRSVSNRITSWLLLLSRAPVGSSAKIIWPPFINARAMDTRCCWPPDNSDGRWVSRSPSPNPVSSSSARWWRLTGAMPA